MRQSHQFWHLIKGYTEQSLEYLEDPEGQIKTPWKQVVGFIQVSQIDPLSVNSITYSELNTFERVQILYYLTGSKEMLFFTYSY